VPRARARAPVDGSSPFAVQCKTLCTVSAVSPNLSSTSKPSSMGAFGGMTSTSSMIRLPFGVGNRMWRMPSEFRLSTAKTKTLVLIDSVKGMPRSLQYALAWANPITVRCAPVSMRAPFQLCFFILRSAMTCNGLVEKLVTSSIESVSIVAVAGCAELGFCVF
jgi:hypothetical protein